MGVKEAPGQRGDVAGRRGRALSGNPVAQGSVDSVGAMHLTWNRAAARRRGTGSRWRPLSPSGPGQPQVRSAAPRAFWTGPPTTGGSGLTKDETEDLGVPAEVCVPAEPDGAAHPDRQRRRDHRGQRLRHRPLRPGHLLLHVAPGRGDGELRRSSSPATPTPHAASSISASGHHRGGLPPAQVQPGRVPGLLVARLGTRTGRRCSRCRRTRPPWCSGRCGAISSASATSSS